MKLKKETLLISIILIPIIYLAFIWNELPNEVPIHWDVEGQIDGYGNKLELAAIAIGIPLLTYFIFSIIPKIDPKNKLNKMGNKLNSIKFLLTTFMSILALIILYSSKNESLTNPNYILLLIGIIYAILGNYFKTIKANYFIGIRTPWTLENEVVWKKTHLIAGKLWFIGGLLVVLSSLVLEKQYNLILFITVTIIISTVPLLYSYIQFKEQKKLEIEQTA